MKLTFLFGKSWLWLYLPVLGLSALCIWFVSAVWLPLPPTSFVMAGDQPSGNYATLASVYRSRLEQRGISVEVIPAQATAGSLGRLLETPAQAAAGFAQGLLAKPQMSQIMSLAALERQPVWIFTRIAELTATNRPKTMRVAVANNGARVEDVAKILLEHAQVPLTEVSLLSMPPEQAASALLDDKVQAAIFIDSSEASSVRQLTRAPGVYMLGLDRVAALVSKEPMLKPFVLPQGTIELRGDVPSRDLTMVATQLNLIVQASMHPALQRELLDVAREIHEMPTFLQRQGEFPNSRDVDFTGSSIAQAWSYGDRPWLERLLPYWWAQLAELIAFAIVPILWITMVLLRWIPNLFDWKVNAILQNFYGELKFLETDIEPVASERPIEIKKLLQRLDSIEAKVTVLDLPNRYANRWYTLREHIARARDRLLNLRAR
jgi:TRAP-type uncharacterized transport system substrate-binding protein